MVLTKTSTKRFLLLVLYNLWQHPQDAHDISRSSRFLTEHLACTEQPSSSSSPPWVNTHVTVHVFTCLAVRHYGVVTQTFPSPACCLQRSATTAPPRLFPHLVRRVLQTIKSPPSCLPCILVAASLHDRCKSSHLPETGGEREEEREEEAVGC